MLFGYPASANANNWLHECVAEILDKLHTEVISGNAPPTWPDIIPASRRQILRRKRGLRDRLEKYQRAFEGLTTAQMQQAHQCLRDQNRLSGLLSGATSCQKLEDLAPAIREPAKKLYEFIFDDLSDFAAIRDEQYRIIYESIRDKVCPFCGLTSFDRPGLVREELDHYLPEHAYTYASVNLWNLVPMCHKCNTGFKKAVDLLWRGTKRCVAINPFNHGELALRLTVSQPYGGNSPYLPRWDLQFVPRCPGLDTWLETFAIHKRYVKSKLLDGYFDDLIKSIAYWCKGTIGLPIDGRALARAITSFMLTLRDDRFKDRAFIKYAISRLIRRQCIRGNEAIVNPILNCIKILP